MRTFMKRECFIAFSDGHSTVLKIKYWCMKIIDIILSEVLATDNSRLEFSRNFDESKAIAN